ncbi:acetyl-CoA carboxylase biotin carboxyl carrier protein subunit [Neisseria gonorrhoeae]|uniref:Acetyl-CoA carboxylase biotin carboxyl carrier protein subunit n=1 Tax=Neisseria gonorrhoeae TaxID=485 RepID=A0A378W264_NEIGO|nr:acetyl-CoA carboxylase biotin carboxyl carrier protein subunit [Neisseria gonorrhoeae]
MDLRKLKKLIDLVEESGIAEIEVTEGEEKSALPVPLQLRQLPFTPRPYLPPRRP